MCVCVCVRAHELVLTRQPGVHSCDNDLVETLSEVPTTIFALLSPLAWSVCFPWCGFGHNECIGSFTVCIVI